MSTPLQLFRPHDIQGDILRPYAHTFATHRFVQCPEAASGQAWLRALVDKVTTAELWDAGEKPTTLNLAFTAAGLRALGVSESVMTTFPAEFLDGMAKRAGLLGDTGTSDPRHWQSAWTERQVHAMVAIHGTGEEVVLRRWAEVEGAMTATGGAKMVGRDDARRLPDSKEHFGFTDGFGQPLLDHGGGKHFPGQGTPDGKGGWKPLALGEFVLGHRDEEGVLPPGPVPQELGHNGTFLVYRKLRQDVVGFRQYLAAQGLRLGLEPGQVGASIVGRWPDGTPLELSPDGPNSAVGPEHNNAFTYGGDENGFRCPVGAHIRRANPRDSLGFEDTRLKHLIGFRPEQLVSRHRMIRRGITYGPPLPEGAEEDGQERGLLFMAAMSSPLRQFEFVQGQWLNSGNLFHLGSDLDLLTGEHDGTGKMTIQGSPPKFLAGIPRLITMRGGDYFFKPGIGGLRWLARG